MPAERADAYQIAINALRSRLREGRLPAGERIAAAEVAAELRLSATPVREALARLAGEGLLEDRRGQGFFVPTLTGTDVADLYRLSQAHLMVALARRDEGADAAPNAAALPDAGGAVAAVEHLFAGWVRRAGGRVLLGGYRRVELQLGPVRRLEPAVIGDLDAEAAGLHALAGVDIAEVRRRVGRFHARRVALATRLSGLLNHARPVPEL